MSETRRNEVEIESTLTQRGNRRQAARFLKGPVPWDWLCRAAQLSGVALALGLFLWRRKGMGWDADGTRLANAALAELGITRMAKSRALTALEEAGLVTVARERGKSPLVRLIPHPPAHPPRPITGPS